VMILCNVLAIAIGKFTIKYPNSGPAMPSPNLFGGFGLPAVLATTSFGHLIGTGVILGLANLGAL
jgi:photosystem I subunit X